MPDQIYTYYGPLSAVSLPADEAHPDGRDVQLARGLTVTLPDDNDYVKSLVARKYLVPVAEPETASPAGSDVQPTAAEVKPSTTVATVGTKGADADKATPAASVVPSASSPAVAASSAKDAIASPASETTSTGV